MVGDTANHDIKERSGAATRREIIEPCNRGGLVTEQIKVTIRTYFEVTEVGAGFGQYLVGKPDCESNEPVVPFFDRPPLAVPVRRSGLSPATANVAGQTQ